MVIGLYYYLVYEDFLMVRPFVIDFSFSFINTVNK